MITRQHLQDLDHTLAQLRHLYWLAHRSQGREMVHGLVGPEIERLERLRHALGVGIDQVAREGDWFSFEYPDSPQHNCVLQVTRVWGDGPDDMVMFSDQTHCKQKHVRDLKKVAGP